MASSSLEVPEEVPEQVAQLLTPEQVGQTLSRHPKTVLRLAASGELRAIKLGVRTVRFDPADVQNYIDRHRTAQIEAAP